MNLVPDVLQSHPRKIVCVGLNYTDHADEVGLSLPDRPLLFAKWTNTLAGPGDPIVIPPRATQVDYEAELALVIGERARRVPRSRAMDVIAGFTCANDVSARDWQFADGQWTRGKSADTFCPVGPRVVPLSEIGDPAALGIRCRVNDELVQDSTTANLIFGIDTLIEFITESVTLEPGDLVLTGTPAGVGMARKPPRFLAPGDLVSVEIDGIGVLTNPVIGG